MLTYPSDLQKEQLDQACALLEEIQTFIDDYAPGTAPRLQSLVETARRLKVFAGQDLQFFSSAALAGQQGYPLEYIFALIHDQVGRDFAILQEAACQRQHCRSPFADTLNQADHLAEEILGPVIRYGAESPKFVLEWPVSSEGQSQTDQKPNDPDDRPHSLPLPRLVPAQGTLAIYPAETIVITYFRKFPSIRLIPYAPVALVGIPFTSVERPQDLLATPHEIGHQVFWRWRALRYHLQQEQGSLPLYAYRWAEEIFADSYGVHTGGPAAALFAQLLEAGFSNAQFCRDDGAHPASILRPYVHIKALSNPKSAPAPLALQELNDLWTGYRAARAPLGPVFTASTGHHVPVDSAVGRRRRLPPDYTDLYLNHPVDRLVRVCLDRLQSIDALAGFPTPWWAPELNHSASQLYAGFASHLNTLDLKKPVKELAHDASLDALLQSGRCLVGLKEHPLWLQVARDYLDTPQFNDLMNGLNNNTPIPARDWLPLMDMDAWADKGPTSNPRSG